MSKDRLATPEHAPTELLSAYLDGRAGGSETAFVDRHLPRCVQCSDELAGLEAVRDLLRRLPDVQPSRSFVLPEPLSPRRPRSRGFWLIPTLQLWTRAAGAVAAAFFVIFLALDLRGYGAEVTVPLTAQSHSTAPTSVPSRAAPASGPAFEAASPAEATRIAERGASKIVADQPRAPAPAAQQPPVQSSPASAAVPSAPTVRPLQLLAIGTGLLALGLLGGSFLIRRRAG